MPMYNLLEFINVVRIILTQQVVYGFIPKMEQLILTMILRIMMILNTLCIRLNYWRY